MKRLVIVAIALIGLAAKPGAQEGDLTKRDCRQAPTPGECYTCCLEADSREDRASTEKACGAFCKHITPQPPSESVPR